MQGDGGYQGIRCKEGPCCLGQPKGCGPHDFMPVAVLERQNQLAPILVIEHGGATLAPRSSDPETIVAGNLVAFLFSGKGYAAQMTGQTGDEGRVPPARATQAEFAFHLCPAQDTAGRINQL